MEMALRSSKGHHKCIISNESTSMHVIWMITSRKVF